jgi:hypothetical protein
MGRNQAGGPREPAQFRHEILAGPVPAETRVMFVGNDALAHEGSHASGKVEGGGTDGKILHADPGDGLKSWRENPPHCIGRLT